LNSAVAPNVRPGRDAGSAWDGAGAGDDTPATAADLVFVMPMADAATED
jgi:hypothetical protein